MWSFITRTEAAPQRLRRSGGLQRFLKHLGIIERFAQCCLVFRASPNAAPVREVVHSFVLPAKVEGQHFCHVRRLTDEPAIASNSHLLSEAGDRKSVV